MIWAICFENHMKVILSETLIAGKCIIGYTYSWHSRWAMNGVYGTIGIYAILKPSGAIWWQRSGSTFMVMACCLTVPSHYLNQWWLNISEILWHSHQGHITGNTWGRDQVSPIFQIISNVFSCLIMYKFWWRFHLNLFRRVQLTMFQHWFRLWLVAGQATSHYQSQCWLVYWGIYAPLGLNKLRDLALICVWKSPI